MRDLIILFVHVITAVVRVFRPGGVRAVIAESVLTKHQLLILIVRAGVLRICACWIA